MIGLENPFGNEFFVREIDRGARHADVLDKGADRQQSVAGLQLTAAHGIADGLGDLTVQGNIACAVQRKFHAQLRGVFDGHGLCLG